MAKKMPPKKMPMSQSEMARCMKSGKSHEQCMQSMKKMPKKMPMGRGGD